MDPGASRSRNGVPTPERGRAGRSLAPCCLRPAKALGGSPHGRSRCPWCGEGRDPGAPRRPRNQVPPPSDSAPHNCGHRPWIVCKKADAANRHNAWGYALALDVRHCQLPSMPTKVSWPLGPWLHLPPPRAARAPNARVGSFTASSRVGSTVELGTACQLHVSSRSAQRVRQQWKEKGGLLAGSSPSPG